MKIELKQAIQDLKKKKEVLYSFFLSEIYPYFRYRTLKGTILNHQSIPLSGLKITLNQKYQTTTDEQGFFCFDDIFASHYSLSLEWEGTALLKWIEGSFKGAGELELKIKWPELIRGQIVNQIELPIKDMKIILNDQWETKSDIHGYFFFPCPEPDPQYHYYFAKLDFCTEHDTFTHQIVKQQNQSELYLFSYQSGELFYLGESPNILPNESYIFELSKYFKYLKYLLILLSLLVFVSSFVRIHPPKIYMQDEELDHYTSITPQSEFTDAFPSDIYQKVTPKPPSKPMQASESTLTEASCEGIEFNYQQYYVPWGMEGFLLESVFGKWQTWQQIAQQNNLKPNQGLHAGQIIQLQLPLFSWEMITVQDKQTVRDILEKKACTHLYCYLMLQVWNPHLDIRVLRENDELLYSSSLMTKSLENQDEIKKVEGIRRFKGIRFKKPPIKLPTACQLSKQVKPSLELDHQQQWKYKPSQLKDIENEDVTPPVNPEDSNDDSWVYEEIIQEQ
jgi:hypothetical protein